MRPESRFASVNAKVADNKLTVVYRPTSASTDSTKGGDIDVGGLSNIEIQRKAAELIGMDFTHAENITVTRDKYASAKATISDNRMTVEYADGGKNADGSASAPKSKADIDVTNLTDVQIEEKAAEAIGLEKSAANTITVERPAPAK